MHDHAEILALGAAAIDFELDADDRTRLHDALETCSLCRRQVSAMRATATVLRRPSDIGTPGRVRDVVIGAALRGGRRTPAFRSLLVASLSILVVLGGTVFIAGNRGFGIIQTTTPTASVPVPTAVAQSSPSAVPTPSPVSPSPTVEPTPAETAPPASIAPADDGPLRAGEIAAMVTDGRLVIRTKPGTGADSAIFKTKVYPGQRVLTLEGPVESAGYEWYRVRLGEIEGWAAAAGLDGDPWLAPVRNGLIAFVQDASDGIAEAIHTIGADGTTGDSLLFSDPNLVHYEQLTWSPDGRRLAFVGTHGQPIDALSEIFVVDADGSNLVQVTDNDIFDDSPTWSPDSRRLAFRQASVDAGASLVDSMVVVVGADGSGLRLLGPGENPVWSPDGLQLAMTVPDGGATSIWVQEAGGNDRRRVSDVAVASTPPSWSPDGLRLVFASSGLFLVEVAAGTITPLTAEPGGVPAWSPRGMIAFNTTGSASPGIFVVDSAGGGLARVTSDNGRLVPEWSPDGLRLLLGSESITSAVIVDPDDGTVAQVAQDTGPYRSPAWQPRLP